MNYERYSYAMAPKQTEWTQTGDPKIGCVQHDCDNCKTHRDLLVRHLAEIERLRSEVKALRSAPFAWWCLESDCITRSAHVRDHWKQSGKTLEPLYK